MLRILEDKGHPDTFGRWPRYVYAPVVPRNAARQSALKQVVRTFFDGSATDAVAALLDMSGRKLTAKEWNELGVLVERAKREGR
jgi:predicted transcriptional regulator